MAKQSKLKKDIFPQHVVDEVEVLMMIIFQGMDGLGEKWTQHLTIVQKEIVALAIALYYDCEHCRIHHTKALVKNLDKKVRANTYLENIESMVLFLFVEERNIAKELSKHWKKKWHQLSKGIAFNTDDHTADLVGLAIGLGRDDNFLIDYCGKRVRDAFGEDHEKYIEMTRDLAAVVMLMKLLASKNRVKDKLQKLWKL